MMTYGEASILGSRIRSSVGIIFVGSFALLMGLLIWQAAFNENPIANAMARNLYQEQQAGS